MNKYKNAQFQPCRSTCESTLSSCLSEWQALDGQWNTLVGKDFVFYPSLFPPLSHNLSDLNSTGKWHWIRIELIIFVNKLGIGIDWVSLLFILFPSAVSPCLISLDASSFLPFLHLPPSFHLSALSSLNPVIFVRRCPKNVCWRP